MLSKLKLNQLYFKDTQLKSIRPIIVRVYLSVLQGNPDIPRIITGHGSGRQDMIFGLHRFVQLIVFYFIAVIPVYPHMGIGPYKTGRIFTDLKYLPAAQPFFYTQGTKRTGK